MNLDWQSCFSQLKEVYNKKAPIRACSKPAFMFNEVTHEQRGGVCMGCSLAPLISTIKTANIEEKSLRV